MATARRGKFGRVPTASPDLTATIISIAQQMTAAEDRNIQSAWQSGGLYEGKPVTDAMDLAHLQTRAQGIDKTDPMYDQYNNEFIQVQYSIAQSKADLAYKQGKLTDTGMAQFYLDWAKKIPPSSEFYRTLQKQAATFLASAAATARAGAAKAKTDAYNAFVSATAKQYIGLGDVLTQVMTQVARDNNLIGQNQDLSNFTLKGEND